MLLTPDRFVAEWTSDGSKLVKCPASALEGLPLDSAARSFLVEIGLPASAPPFLTFEFPDPGKGKLQTVLAVLGVAEDEIEEDDDRALAKELWVIGHDGGGDKIGVAKDGRVHVFDHASLTTLPMSGSLPNLASDLVAYRAYSKGGRAEELVAKGDVEGAKTRLRAIVKELRDLDAASYDAGSFWQRLLGTVLLRISQDPTKRALAQELAEILRPPR